MTPVHGTNAYCSNASEHDDNHHVSALVGDSRPFVQWGPSSARQHALLTVYRGVGKVQPPETSKLPDGYQERLLFSPWHTSCQHSQKLPAQDIRLSLVHDTGVFI